MKWKTITNTGAEIGFVVVKNGSTAYSVGQVVCWDVATDATFGLEAVDASAANAGLVAGLAHAATPADEKGLVQCYGYDSDALIVRNGMTATNDTLAAGNILDILSALSCLIASKAAGAVLANTFAATNNAAATVIPPLFVLMESFASYATSNVTTNAKVFIRCL